MTVTVELNIRRLQDDSLVAELRARLPHIHANLGNAPVKISFEVLRSLSLLSEDYGAALTAMALPQVLYPAWQLARGFVEGSGQNFRIHVALDDPLGELDALRWELLRDPLTNVPLAQQESSSLARFVILDHLYNRALPTVPTLRALVAIAGPVDAEQWGLDPVDVACETARVRQTLGGLQADFLANTASGSANLATLSNLRNGLRSGPHVLYLICHGRMTEAGTTLYLVNDDNRAAPITGADLAAEIAALDPGHRPLLAILVACEGANQNQAPLASAGPLLARGGIPAVVAMQAPISMDASASFMGRLLRELRRDGRIERAVAAARKEMSAEWWLPVLYTRLYDGRLWEDEAAPDLRHTLHENKLHALLHDHSGFIASRLEAFVGREQELAEIRERVAAMKETGGYVIVNGQAGQGKSSLIARLVADSLQAPSNDVSALRECLQEPAVGVPICHFIPFSPGSDHQVGLLRNLLARLCLTYRLPDFYATSESRPALRDYFAAALRDVASQGHREIIYLDGLDQLVEDVGSVRDLSFLPEEPPAGIVFVLGTRPNDTLKPLELRMRRREYWLRALTRDDFGLMLTHRQVTIDTLLADRFYAAMQKNALYLDLVARELYERGTQSPEELIGHIADNSDNIFSLTIERFKHNRHQQWREVLKPILGLLLAARVAISARALRTMLGVDDETTREALQRLGGLIQRDGEGRYELFHLKLGEYLRAEVFAPDEEEERHQRLVMWCESGKGGIDAIWANLPNDDLERERRSYARQHYIAHLAMARHYERLWATIDAGDYGRAKRRYDPSTRSYTQDLNIACHTVLDATAGDTDAQVQALPQLWRISLLRCSLSSQADTYPENLLLVLVAIGRGEEAINRAELISDPVRKVNALRSISAALLTQESEDGRSLLLRARIVADTIPDSHSRSDALSHCFLLYPGRHVQPGPCDR